ncbi:DMT family transporter [Candidatus Woesearchaeota archaeon]|nr:DMT family transporter [Candidatus Woesearchaeota archaeon]
MKKGIILSVASSFFIGTNNVISKYLLQHLNILSLISVWFAFAAIINLLVAAYANRKKFVQEAISSKKAGLIIGLSNIASAGTFFASIHLLGPAPTAFFLKLEVIFLVLLGYLFLKEKLNLWEIAGMITAIAGGFVYAFSSAELSANAYVAVISALAIAINTILIRHYVQKHSITILQAYRTLITALVFSLAAISTKQLQIPAASLIALAAIGSVLSAVIGVGLHYSSLKHIKAALSGIIRNLDPVVVTAYAYLLFGTSPGLQEWIGGAIILAGVTLTVVSMSRNKLYKSAKMQP